MRKLVFAALFFGAALWALGQAAAPPQALPKDPHEILAMAAPYYDFNDPSLKPWHLKATYQLYDDHGKPTEQGTFEYWWASPKVHRSSWTRPSATRTDWELANGSNADMTSGDRLSYFEARLISELLSPLPSPAEQDPEKTRAVRNHIKAGGQALPCISLIWNSLGGLMGPVDFPTYCFDPALPVLRLSSTNSGALSTTFNKITRFQGKFLATEMTVSTGSRVLFSVNVDRLNEIGPADPNLVPSKDAELKPAGATVSSEEANQLLIKKEFPLYPLVAKESRIQGTVLIEAVIGTDGKIKQKRVIASPSPILSASSLECVSHWEYKPYHVNGVPEEVDTLISVAYTLGR